ncbi:5875_t:CDS:2, partial [Racocetra persica]
GSSIHISDFVCESIRRLKLSDYEIGINGLLPDSMHLKYTEAVECAIPIFERTHPNKIALFMFDNSSNHGSFAEDALLVSQIGMKDGTKKPLLRDGTMPDGSKHIMTYIDNANVKRPKGIKRVLEERGLWIPGLIKKYDTCKKNKSDPNNPNCCTSRILSAQPDFAAQRSCIREINNAYELGLSGKAADFAVKKYRSHRQIPEQVLEEFAHD